jgi:PAS domain S-box-containing protein
MASVFKRAFISHSMKWKCTLALLLTAGLAMFIANIALAAIEWFSLRHQMVEKLHAEANIIAANTTIALISRNQNEVESILRKVEPVEDITVAMLYDENGLPFAAYTRSGVSALPTYLGPRQFEYEFRKGNLDFYLPVVADERVVGTVYLRSSLANVYWRIGETTGITFFATLLALLAAIALTARVYRYISEPIISLRHLMHRVLEEKNFTLQAPIHGQDEVSDLAASFNKLLGMLEASDREREQEHRRLDELVAARTVALNESEQRYRLLFEQAPICIAITDIEGHFILVNQAGADMVHEQSTDVIIGKTVWDYVHPESAKEIHANWQKAVRTLETVICVEHKLLRADNTIAYAECNIIPFFERETLLMQIVVPDRTEQKLAETELRHYAERLEVLEKIDKAILAAHSPDAIAQAALSYVQRLLPCIRASVTLFDMEQKKATMLAVEGLGRERLRAGVQISLDEVFGDIDALRHGEIHRVEDTTTVSFPQELRFLVGLGMRSYMNIPLVVQDELLGTLNIGADEANTFSAGHRKIAREVANSLAVAIQHMRLYQQASMHADELEQRVAERTAELTTANQELSRFSYSVSHDLRTPLRGINGFSLILLEDYDSVLDEEGRKYLQRIRAAAVRMGDLIDNMLTLAHVTRVEMKRRIIDLSSIAKNIFDDLRATAPERQVECHLQQGAVANGDPTLMTVVLNNLLDNAWKFTSKCQKARIEFGYRDEGSERLFYVSDNGVGFDMAYVGKLFTPFQRLHTPDEFPGNGIGLATVRRIIERHGGRVWAEGAVSKGATFTFTLPLNNSISQV